MSLRPLFPPTSGLLLLPPNWSNQQEARGQESLWEGLPGTKRAASQAPGQSGGGRRVVVAGPAERTHYGGIMMTFTHTGTEASRGYLT